MFKLVRCLVLLLFSISIVSLSRSCVFAEECGRQTEDATCPGNYCCSELGYCGSTLDYCGYGCQSGPCFHSVSSIISRELFDEMLEHRNDDACPAKGFYTYEAFIAAADSFGGFGTTGDVDTRKREIAAFLGQTSHATSGRSDHDPYSWGYCFKEQDGSTDDYCVSSDIWPCAPDKNYHGRGPIQITYNTNYGPAGDAIGQNLLNDPDLVATDPFVSFETAIWFWMTAQSPKPSCHSVMVMQWTPSSDDLAAGRSPGYGLTTNILNGTYECGIEMPSTVVNRIGFYKRYCDLLGVDYGSDLTLECDNQQPWPEPAAAYLM